MVQVAQSPKLGPSDRRDVAPGRIDYESESGPAAKSIDGRYLDDM